jgi:hypothetical protein
MVNKFQSTESHKDKLTNKGFLSKLASREDLNNVQDPSDAIDFYNKKNMKPSELQDIKPVHGAFYKVRQNGGASGKDIAEHNKFFKRGAYATGLALVHTYALMTILY